MRRLLLVILALAVLAVGAPWATNARITIGDIDGVVLTAAGRPVGGATVIMQTSDGSRPYATRADDGGRFEFQRYETGDYDLRASDNGHYSEWLRRVRIRSGKTTTITLRLTLNH